MSLSPERSTLPHSSGLSASAEELRSSLQLDLPANLAARTDAIYREKGNGVGNFSLSFLSAPIRLTYPDLIAQGETGEVLPLPVQVLILYYFSTSGGTPRSGKWVSFGDLPGGRIYAQAFQGYSGEKLSRQFGNQIEMFQSACRAADGQPAEGGDSAFLFLALPRIPLCVTYWQGEDEFPATCKILFDTSVCSHLPIDVCAILGSMLVSKISKAAANVQDKALHS